MKTTERYVIEGPVPTNTELEAMLNDVAHDKECDHVWLWLGQRGLPPMPRASDGVTEQFDCGQCGETVIIERRPSVIAEVW